MSNTVASNTVSSSAKTARSLADVLENCFAAVTDAPLTRAWRRPRAIVCIVVDGLGAVNLRGRSGNARFLSCALERAGENLTVFPSTTAAALTTLTTGLLPGEHGLPAYRAYDRPNDRVLTMLSDWDERAIPEEWQPHPTLFEAHPDVPSRVIAHAKYRDSGFTRAHLRGAEFTAARTIADRLDAAAKLANGGPGVNYVYLPELDMIAHSAGWNSLSWSDRLEELDGLVADFVAALPTDVGVVLTADHGIIDIPESNRLTYDLRDLAGVRHIAGEPRAVQLVLEPEADIAAVARAVPDAMPCPVRVLEPDAEELAPLLGPVSAAARSRMGELIVLPEDDFALYEREALLSRGSTMVGHHGGLSASELEIPVLTWNLDTSN